MKTLIFIIAFLVLIVITPAIYAALTVIWNTEENWVCHAMGGNPNNLFGNCPF